MRALTVLCLVGVTAWGSTPYRGGVVAAAHPLGAEAGKAMLDAGGNAIDAVVAAAFTMAVVGPYHSGLGGGGFAVVHLANERRDLAFDFREVAPGLATHDMYLEGGQLVAGRSTDGALSIAVPGAVKGYLELHAKYGRLSRAQVLAPAIAAASRGFIVTPKYRDLAQKRLECLQRDPDAAAIFLHRGAAPPLGFRLVQRDLAKTLSTLARAGDAPFYRGAIARQLASEVEKKGGLLRRTDLERYQTRWHTPLEGSYRGHRVVTMPPPSAGGLAMLQTFGLIEAKGAAGPGTRQVEAMHTFIEALRRAYADRSSLVGDPAFVPSPAQRLLAPSALEAQAKTIGETATRSSALPPPPFQGPEPKNTTHISVIDGQGNAVALTTTINYYFGSCVVAKGTGVLLNDEMDDFAAQPGVPNAFGLVMGEANAVAPGKVPVSSMTPTLVFMKGRPTEVMLAVGSPGGSTIPTTVMQVISNLIDGSLDVTRAVSRGRIHHQWLPDSVWVDPDGLDPATRAALEAKGHTFQDVPGWGDAEAVMVDPSTGLRTGASDPRNEGRPAGQE